MRQLVIALCWVSLGVVWAPGSEAQSPSRRVDTSVTAVVDAAAAYLKEYQDKLTYVLADEIYTQQIHKQVPFDATMPRSRILRSELFFMFAPADRVWMAMRDVAELDGKAVDHRPDLKSALQTLPATQVARTFKTYNSRFNLGHVIRNFNEPTLSLLVLDSNHRPSFTFERRRVERTSGAVLVTLAFSERKPPTLIRDLSLRPVFSTGELVVEAGTGRVRRALLKVKIGSVQVELATAYSHEARLGMWVPTVFRERYEEGVAAGADTSFLSSSVPAGTRPPAASAEFEEIVCEAKYTNYRRFETAWRIK